MNTVKDSAAQKQNPAPDVTVVAPVVSDDAKPGDEVTLPHAERFRMPIHFEEAAEPDDEGEQRAAQDDDAQEKAAQAKFDPWANESREPWQHHSELGPNPGAERLQKEQEVLTDIVNPHDHDWGASAKSYNAARAAKVWGGTPGN